MRLTLLCCANSDGTPLQVTCKREERGRRVRGGGSILKYGAGYSARAAMNGIEDWLKNGRIQMKLEEDSEEFRGVVENRLDLTSWITMVSRQCNIP
jgi:hypothetical protein